MIPTYGGIPSPIPTHHQSHRNGSGDYVTVMLFLMSVQKAIGRNSKEAVMNYAQHKTLDVFLNVYTTSFIIIWVSTTVDVNHQFVHPLEPVSY